MSLTNTQYDTIMRQYEARQNRRRHIREERLRTACQQYPSLKELMDDISDLSLTRAKMLLNGDEQALSLLKEELSALTQKKQELLSSLGLSGDYFEPPYQCPHCKDTGYIGHEKCHCFKQAAIDLVYTQSNLKNILKEENFDTLSLEYYTTEDADQSGRSSRQRAEDAVAQCKGFLKDFDTTFGNLFLYGDTGVGKTFLSHCVARELLDSGHSVIYFTAFELFQIFERATFGRERQAGASGDYQNLFDCELLIIDDLGTEFSNSFTTSQLFLCLNERILRRKSTIISTNLNIPQLAELYSERTFSRVTSHYTMIKLTGSDIRILKKIRGC